jgi:hypothetical protein
MRNATGSEPAKIPPARRAGDFLRKRFRIESMGYRMTALCFIGGTDVARFGSMEHLSRYDVTFR